MGYLQNLGLHKSNYDKTPFIEVKGYENDCWTGWESVVARLKEAICQHNKDNVVIAFECYSGVHDNEIIAALKDGLHPKQFIRTEAEVFKSETEINAMLEPYLGGNDPIFGRLTHLTIEAFIDPAKRSALASEGKTWTGVSILYGPGALLCGDADIVVYADMPRWEGQLRQRRNEVNNLGINNREEDGKMQYKRSFFVDWRVCDKLKRETLEKWDFFLDSCIPNNPKLISGCAFRTALEQASQQPFRVVPFFDPGVWGGQWMREVCELPEGPANYAWCFDCVPEENSILLDFGGTKVEIPAMDLVFRHPKELLGEPVYGLFGAEFPIRFDFLDTMEGQNLSFQVHPLVDYAYEAFGLRYTQDESYYILDASEDAEVFLGLKDDVDPDKMLNDLKTASEDPAQPFPAEKHVARFPARKHDHFLIPAGTCHCSGANSMVLEISHTPYIFTFKMWDWDRLDLNGKPRPINLERGAANIQWERTASWVEKNLVNRIEKITSGEGWSEERTGLYESEFIETRRHWFTATVPHDTRGQSVHVINLVQGAEAIVESPTGAFDPYIVHYAETFIVPASVGAYTIRPYGSSIGKECATLKAYIRVNP